MHKERSAPSLAIPFLISAVLIGFAGWSPIDAPTGPTVSIASSASFRPARIMFAPSNVTLRPGQHAQVSVSLDTDGMPVNTVDLQLAASHPSANILLTPASDCAVSAGGLALRCQFQENAAMHQLIPLGQVSIQAGQAADETAVTISPDSRISSPTLSGINRLRYFPALTIDTSP